MAEESVKNKSLFLSNMSHEVRTPLNALAGFSSILSMDGIDDDTIRECDDIIRLNSDLLLKLINDVVDISCIDLEHMEFHLASCDAVALCKYVEIGKDKAYASRYFVYFELRFVGDRY